MKKIVIYPESSMEQSSEIFQTREPMYLHSVLWIILVFVLVVFGFAVFGHIDEVIRSNGVVRPQSNISSVNNITSGEIENVFYEPGEYVKAGQKLLTIRGDILESQKKAVCIQSAEISKNIIGLKDIIKNYENDMNEFSNENMTFKARYDAFLAERRILQSKVDRMRYLYELEKQLPESSTTRNNIETSRYDFEVSELELNEFCKSFICGVRQEYDSFEIQQKNITEQIKQLDVSLENLVLVSPINGYVQEISSLNPGDYIFSDQQVLNIVPVEQNKCRIELHVPAEKMGKLEIGQRVKLRFPAFPYSEYRGINGTLKIIQPDSQVSDSGYLYFVVYADVDSMELYSKKGIAYQIKPGYEVDARIVLDNQSLMYFLLKKLDLTV